MTAPDILERSPVTAALLAALRAIGKPVGDGRIPPGANWVGGVNTPGSRFVPYAVLSEIVSSHSSGPIGDSQADWQLPYLVESFGVSREACGWMSDRVIAAARTLRTALFTQGDVRYGVQQVRIDSIGAPVRVEAVQPPVWRKPDGITIWVGKGA